MPVISLQVPLKLIQVSTNLFELIASEFNPDYFDFQSGPEFSDMRRVSIFGVNLKGNLSGCVAHSYNTQLAILMHALHSNLDLFFDLKKAFDKVLHILIMQSFEPKSTPLRFSYSYCGFGTLNLTYQ